MIALAGIVTRDSIILVDFIHLFLGRGRTLFHAVMESRGVRLRPILLTAGTAMLSAAPITIDPIFSGLASDLRPLRLHSLHPLRDPHHLLAALRARNLFFPVDGATAWQLAKCPLLALLSVPLSDRRVS